MIFFTVIVCFLFVFLFSFEECRNTLMHIGVRELTPQSVARIVSMMVKTSGGVSDPLPMQVSFLLIFLHL